jgi:hypothetical protein
MPDTYSNFFLASAGASAAFIGLLFVALTIAKQEQRDDRARTRRQSLAASSFALLLDAFFVSLSGLAADVYVFASISLGVAAFGLLVTSRHLPRAIRSGNLSRGASARTVNILLPTTSILTYVLQLVFATGVLLYPHNSDLLRLSVLVSLGLYGGALARAWEITKT